jgi:hypothetical protein
MLNIHALHMKGYFLSKHISNASKTLTSMKDGPFLSPHATLSVAAGTIRGFKRSFNYQVGRSQIIKERRRGKTRNNNTDKNIM